MEHNDRYQWHDGLASVETDDGLILLAIESGFYFNFNNKSGRAIWLMLEKPRSIAEIAEELIQRFDVSKEACMAEVESFVAQLEAKELVTRIAEPSLA